MSGSLYSSVSSLAGYAFTAAGTCYAHSNGAIYGLFAANEPAITDAGYVAHPAVTNLLLNAGSSSGLATQNVTVSAVEYTLSFVGTGEVVLSGVHSATLTGTGASDRVTLTFTPTAGTLTCTVTGSVTFASLNTGKASVIVPTAGATATRGEALLTHDIFADASALTDQDMLIWAKGTPEEFVSASWHYAVDLHVDVNNSVQLYLDTSGAVGARIFSAGVNVYNPTVAGAVPVGTEATLVLRRSSGNWRAGKYVGGTLTWGTESAAAFPAGITKAMLGNYQGTANCFRGTLDSCFIKPGTFDTDQKAIDAITGAP